MQLLNTHGRRQGGARGCTCTPLEFESDDVICCLQAKCTQSFALASGARTNCPSIYYKMSNISKISFLHNIEVLCQHWWHAAEDYMLRWVLKEAMLCFFSARCLIWCPFTLILLCTCSYLVVKQRTVNVQLTIWAMSKHNAMMICHDRPPPRRPPH